MSQLSDSSLNTLPASIAPSYTPNAHKAGILHLGVGAFHRAHQAVYTDTALAQTGGDWRIVGVSMRSTEIADTLNAQDGLFTLVERGSSGTSAKVIGSIEQVLAASRDVGLVLAEFTKPNIRVVTLTVTEKAYGIDRSLGDIDMSHPAVAADLQNPSAPQSVLGLLTQGLRLRRDALRGSAALTILCCDNLPENGQLLRAGVLGFARRIDAELATWIEDNIAFPSSMVDRITPAATELTFNAAQDLTGLKDLAAIETEPFLQWVIEDNFVAGHPDWAAGGALFVKDVAPYENMKLRMLNGAHSLLAYAGFLAGHTFIRDTMQDAPLKALTSKHMIAAAATLDPLDGINFDTYRSDLIERFINPEIAHETYQIAMDGTQKMQQRIFTPALSALSQGQDCTTFAFATAAWMRYALGVDENGQSYELRDPLEDQIKAALKDVSRASCINASDAMQRSRDIIQALTALPNFMPQALKDAKDFIQDLQTFLTIILKDGIAQAIREMTSEGSTS